jgi:hypothetical protein
VVLTNNNEPEQDRSRPTTLERAARTNEQTSTDGTTTVEVVSIQEQYSQASITNSHCDHLHVSALQIAMQFVIGRAHGTTRCECFGTKAATPMFGVVVLVDRLWLVAMAAVGRTHFGALVTAQYGKENVREGKIARSTRRARAMHFKVSLWRGRPSSFPSSRARSQAPQATSAATLDHSSLSSGLHLVSWRTSWWNDPANLLANRTQHCHTSVTSRRSRTEMDVRMRPRLVKEEAAESGTNQSYACLWRCKLPAKTSLSPWAWACTRVSCWLSHPM